MQHFHTTLAFKPLIPYALIPHFVSSPSPPPSDLGCLSTPLASSFPLTPSGFFNGMLAVTEPRALNCYTFFRLISLILFVSRNLTLIHFPFSGSLNSLLCVLIAPTPGLAFSPVMPAAVSSFSSGRAYLSLNFLPPLFA